MRDNLKQLEVVTRATRGITAVVGFVDEDGATFNAAAVMHDGELKAVYHKVFLPNYGVFDEQRYFEPGHLCPILELDGVRIGVSVCEDCWYPSGPMAWEAHHGAELLININGSPYHAGKRPEREAMVSGRAATTARSLPRSTPSAARTSSSSMATASCSARAARCWRTRSLL